MYHLTLPFHVVPVSVAFFGEVMDTFDLSELKFFTHLTMSLSEGSFCSVDPFLYNFLIFSTKSSNSWFSIRLAVFLICKILYFSKAEVSRCWNCASRYCFCFWSSWVIYPFKSWWWTSFWCITLSLRAVEHSRIYPNLWISS